MATTKLVLSFISSSGDSQSFSYNYAKDEPVDADVKALMEGMITNGDIFENPPAALKSAKVVVTNESAIDLS